MIKMIKFEKILFPPAIREAACQYYSEYFISYQGRPAKLTKRELKEPNKTSALNLLPKRILNCACEIYKT